MLLQLFCFGQYNRSNRKDSAKIIDADYKQYSLNVTEPYQGAGKLPFNKISFNDVRYDTSFIAVNWQSNMDLLFLESLNKKYTLDNGLAASLTNYFHQYYADNFSDNGAALVCYIKKFAITLKDTLLDFYKPKEGFNEEKINNIHVEIEGYYKTGDALYPAFRMDTVYAYRFTKIKREFPQFIKEIIGPLIRKINIADTAKILSRKPYNEEQVAEKYQSRFKLPILTADSVKKGIYKNFDEFRNNAPSITNFTIKTDRMRINASAIKRIDATSLVMAALQRKSTTVFLYDTNGELISPATIFGFSDGSTSWIEHGAFFYPLIRVANAFEFLYIFYYNDGNDHTHSMKVLFPLSMENGSLD